MDRFYKLALSDVSLQYKYKGDPNVPIGVLGFLDDTLGISECGDNVIRKNSIITLFIENLRQELSKSRSEQAPEIEFHPCEKSDKMYFDILGLSWCNKKVNPETQGQCASYELLVTNVAHQIKDK